MLSRAQPRTAAVIDARMGALHVGAQLSVSLGGEVVADTALGLARPDVPMTPATVMPWMSCTKATAVARGRGLVDLDAPVAGYIPASAAGGKAPIGLRPLLTPIAALLPAEGALGPVRHDSALADNGGSHLYGFGAHASPPAFGHVELRSSVALADSEVVLARDRSVAFPSAGTPG